MRRVTALGYVSQNIVDVPLFLISFEVTCRELLFIRYMFKHFLEMMFQKITLILPYRLPLKKLHIQIVCANQLIELRCQVKF